MKKGIISGFVLCILVLVFTSQNGLTDENCGGEGVEVLGGEYGISNNVWGGGPGVGEQCIDVYPDSTYFKVTHSTHDDNEVASYPFIYKGCHWGGCTTVNNPFPMQIWELESAPFTWEINTEGVNGVWNAAFEAFFSPTGATSPNGGGELMIWLDYHGGASPAGSLIEVVNIGGIDWNLRYVVWDIWNYIAYQAVTPIDSVTLDLKDFIHDACTRGYLQTNWFFDNMEAGFEIWRDGQGLTSLYYSADAIDGAEPVNYAPIPFRLRRPRDNRAINEFEIEFEWTESLDANTDPIEYLLTLTGPGVDTTFTGLTDLSLLYDGTGYLQSDTIYTWIVEATDGIDITTCNAPFTFRSPEFTDVDSRSEIVSQFILNQNYPNPFNAKTEISFSLERSEEIHLSVYNTLGRRVQVLIHEILDAGQHSVIFDASDLPSSIYYYELKATSGLERRKCIYLK
ncbi:T9SS type A sorting domain-containing protein [candidate division KSB1 bacterium]|nr:T9SS type A sorting domain-containing protein [candidate division KSB1 bacterium]